jgi:cyclopropane fatty-acyl-phospholipid synthase-like methyltransferase
MPWSITRLASAGRRKLATARHRGPEPGAGEQSDEEFVEACYRDLLGRPADAPGLAHNVAMLRSGVTRAEIVDAMKRSDEYRSRTAPDPTSALPDLTALAPARFTVEQSTDGEAVPVYLAPDAAAYDWIDAQIAEHKYYEQPGIWTLGVDTDKHVMGELISLLQPATTIEIGCSSGAVVQCLVDRGIDAHGIDISEYAKQHAGAGVRDRLHIGDVRQLSLGRVFDVGYGLDIFEHVNPNHLDAFIDAFSALVGDGGWLFANIPAFGADAQFGEVFPMFLPSWRADAARGEHFGALQTDERGFPMHGHLVWASTDWWVERFAAHGFTRQPEIEAELHRVYDWYFETASPARKSFYVFAKGTPANADVVRARLHEYESEVLAPVRKEWRDFAIGQG